ncbi:GDP-mannose 4,6-dehydratase [Candidatus Falkowbacteria bacterium]|nr:GDP-mannose 4,6-dehydratase [Candidatus Falkowbacteria bacterium]
MNKKNVVILGGAGFIGSHLCDRLVTEDVNIVCVDNFITSSEQNIEHLLRLPNFKFIRHDINEPLVLEKFPELKNLQLDVFGVQEIYNLACPTSVKNFDKYKEQTMLTNSVGLKNALDLAVKYKAKFLQASSSVVYGISEKPDYVVEKFHGPSDQLDPRACYDEGKRFAETMCEVYREKLGIDTKIVRIFRTYGPRMLLNDGQMIPDFILSAIEGRDIVIFGDKKFRTSLCYVSDIVEGLINIMDLAMIGAVNLGSPEIVTLTKVAELINKIVATKSKIIYEDRLLFMRELAFPNIQKAKDELGWIPLITLEDGLRRTIEYTKAHKPLVGFGG